MRLLVNENFPLSSTQLLKKAGFDIKAIGIDNPGITDKEVLGIADKENRTIVTFDKDYGELIYKHGYKPKAGVIFMRLYEFDPETPGEYLLKIFKNTDMEFRNSLSVVDSDKIRQRKY